MKLSIHQRGGFLSVDQRIEVEDGLATVSEDGKVKHTRRLDDSQRLRIEALVQRLPSTGPASPPRESDLPSDAMATEIDVEDGEKRCSMNLVSGDSAPDEVWEFLAAANELLESD